MPTIVEYLPGIYNLFSTLENRRAVYSWITKENSVYAVYGPSYVQIHIRKEDLPSFVEKIEALLA